VFIYSERIGGMAPLVGRANERAALAAALERARRGATGEVVAVAGEPGIGKSRLLAELAESAEGCVVLGAAASEFEDDLPYAIWAEAIDVSSDAGLREVCKRAGLEWPACTAAIDNEKLLERVQANTDELAELGHWGVPVFQFEGELFWGQDRIEDLERELRSVGLEW